MIHSTAGRDLDYLMEVGGDLARPRLEADMHDAYAWVGLDGGHDDARFALYTFGRCVGD